MGDVPWCYGPGFGLDLVLEMGFRLHNGARLENRLTYLGNKRWVLFLVALVGLAVWLLARESARGHAPGFPVVDVTC